MIYKVDSRRRTFGELWRLHRPRADRFLAAALNKLFDVSEPPRFGIRRPDRLHIHTPEDLPRAVTERLAGPVVACGDLGLALQFVASVDAMVGGRTRAYSAAMLHAGGLAWATAVVAVVGRAARPAHLNCFSMLRDGRFAATSDHRWRLTPHPDDLPEYLPGATPEAVVARHLARLEAPDVWPVRVTAAELPEVILGREQRHVDYQVGRGVYVPMTRAEIDRLTGGESGG